MNTKNFRPVLTCVALLLGLAVSAPAARGQDRGTLVIDAGAGIGLPVGDLSDVSDPGPAFDFGVSYALSPTIAVRGGLQAEVYGGATGPGGEGPTVRLFHLLVGPAFHLVRAPSDRGFGLTAFVGVGGTAFTTGRKLVGAGATVRTIDISKFYPGVAARLEAHYSLSPSAALFLGATGTLTFAKADDTEPFTILNPAVTDMTKLVSVPITAGVRLTFPE
ncbi:MAG TPA: outer membrane beta-barrel protein [Gemmatimonadota bacterium]|nr:outer membrane beta-barrel protein [Gemmatimonadota bacterium]